MSIKTATRTAILGVSVSLVIYLMAFFVSHNLETVIKWMGSAGGREVSSLIWALSLASHVFLTVSILLFLVVLNSKQKSQAAS